MLFRCKLKQPVPSERLIGETFLLKRYLGLVSHGRGSLLSETVHYYLECSVVRTTRMVCGFRASLVQGRDVGICVCRG